MFDQLEHVRAAPAGGGWAIALRWSAALLLGLGLYAVIAPDCGPSLRERACEQVTQIARLVAAHRDAHAKCPSEVGDLVAPSGRYVDVFDPWGTPFAVQCDDRHVIVVSAGHDRVQHTEDDVVSGGCDSWLSACAIR